MEQEIQEIIRLREERIAPIARAFKIESLAKRVFKTAKTDFFLCEFDVATLRFTLVSENSLVLFGYTAKEMEGRLFSDFLYRKEDVISSIEAVDDNLKDGKRVMNHTNWYLHKNGVKIIKMLWFSDAATDSLSFCIGIPVSEKDLQVTKKPVPKGQAHNIKSNATERWL